MSRRRKALEAMASQDVSPHERDIARAKLAKLPPEPPEPTVVTYRQNTFGSAYGFTINIVIRQT